LSYGAAEIAELISEPKEDSMQRSLCKGAISFGLMHIPVQMFSAEDRGRALDLTMLDERDFAPIGYKRVNKDTGKEVDWNDIVKGYEYEKDHFVVLQPEAEKARARA
jgi:DNA end-binding protein Ku